MPKIDHNIPMGSATMSKLIFHETCEHLSEASGLVISDLDTDKTFLSNHNAIYSTLCQIENSKHVSLNKKCQKSSTHHTQLFGLYITSYV